MRALNTVSTWAFLCLSSSLCFAAEKDIGDPRFAEESAYLKCSSKNDPEGLNDLYIDSKAQTITDSFGTVNKYKIEGQFLVAETFVEVGFKRTLSASTRLNRFTLVVTWISPPLNIFKTASCVKVEKKL